MANVVVVAAVVDGGSYDDVVAVVGVGVAEVASYCSRDCPSSMPDPSARILQKKTFLHFR